MRSAARIAEVLPRPFQSTERHPFVDALRQISVQRAKELQMLAGQIALLVHNTPEADDEITRWISAAGPERTKTPSDTHKRTKRELMRL